MSDTSRGLHMLGMWDVKHITTSSCGMYVRRCQTHHEVFIWYVCEVKSNTSLGLNMVCTWGDVKQVHHDVFIWFVCKWGDVKQIMRSSCTYMRRCQTPTHNASTWEQQRLHDTGISCQENVIPVSIMRVLQEPQNNAAWRNFDGSASDHYRKDI